MNIVKEASRSLAWRLMRGAYWEGEWLIVFCYSVAFKHKHRKKLVWYTSTEAKTPEEASKEAVSLRGDGWREYGISGGYYLRIPYKDGPRSLPISSMEVT